MRKDFDMATFIANPNKSMDFDSLDFSDLVGNVLVTQSPNTWQTKFGVIGNDEIVYHGVGLTYTGGMPTGGTRSAGWKRPAAPVGV